MENILWATIPLIPVVKFLVDALKDAQKELFGGYLVHPRYISALVGIIVSLLFKDYLMIYFGISIVECVVAGLLAGVLETPFIHDFLEIIAGLKYRQRLNNEIIERIKEIPSE